MSQLLAKDGAAIYYKDEGAGSTIVFSHAWPLNSDAWDAQMLFFAGMGYRTVAHDRRGHGRSEQTWDHNDIDTYADDLADLMEHLDLQDTILVGHSIGAGEVARYLARHGSRRVSRVVLISTATPLMLKSKDNPDGIPMEVFDSIRKGVETNRSQYYLDFAAAFFGFDRDGAVPSEGLVRSFWLQAMSGGIKAQWDGIKQFSETDFHADLASIGVPALVIHSEDDQLAPFAITGQATAKLIKNAELKSYKGLSHGMPLVNPEEINQDLLEFIRRDPRGGPVRDCYETPEPGSE